MKTSIKEDFIRIAIVSGANRGIGLEASRQLAERGYLVIMGSRSKSAGEKAAAQLQKQGYGAVAHPLDITSDKSVDALYKMVAKNFGRVDVLVNNAGVFPDPSSANEKASSAFRAKLSTLREGFEVNTVGSFRMCQKFIPLMVKNRYGRVVNVSSGMGQLDDMNGCCPGYRLSKTALNAVTRIFADETKGSGVLVNSMCPGWVKTRMGGNQAPRSVKQGADTIIWLATLNASGPTGGFFRDRKRIAW